ncbi:cupin domain-containing protein [Pararhizobium qamdonense]|uniref:cupin domain-containing protein n=1 Tax=Pararhizobium qamdonense TaxID=3031126 RepID=UPI0023E0C12A|nr:cupin domain-containing protein [Pararhizobium qamdonense]
MQNVLKAFKRREAIGSSVNYMGSLLTFLAESKDTGGAFSLFEILLKPGNEPPPHIHHSEDELYYVLEGEASVYVEVEEFAVKGGDCIFLPREKAHAFIVKSQRFRMLFLTQPGGAEDYFRTMTSSPASTLELPRETPTYSTADIQEAIKLGTQYGLEFLDPERTKELLPGFHEALLTRG